MRRLAGSHEPNNKNRSSKHLNLLIGNKSVYKSMNTSELNSLNTKGAAKERARRAKGKKSTEQKA